MNFNATPNQKRVLESIHSKKNKIIIAEAACGKSTVLIEFYRLLVQQILIPATSIICITFTVAAGERTRKDLAVPNKYTGTYHAIAFQILSELGLVNPDSDLLDSDEILVQFLEFLRSNSPEAIRFKQSIKYVLADEVQDNNALMIQILMEMKEFATIICVGDDWQAIMGFQGANVKYFRRLPMLLSTTKPLEECEVFYLSENWRNSTPILHLALGIRHCGRLEEYMQKPEARSAEEYMWDINNIPSEQRKTKSPKPKLNHAADITECCLKAAVEIRDWIQRTGKPAHYNGVVLRTNAMLREMRSILLKMNIPCALLRVAAKQSKMLAKINRKKRQREDKADDEEETHVDDDEEEKIDVAIIPGLENKVILGTPYTWKGLESVRGHIIGLHDRFWPHKLEPDVEKERRVLYVAVTRFKEELVLWNCILNPSLFLQELQDRNMLTKLVNCDLPFLPVPNNKVMKDEQALDDEKITKIIANSSPDTLSNLLPEVNGWVNRLNGVCCRIVKNELLPRPLKLRIRPVPILYSIPTVDQQEDQQKDNEVLDVDNRLVSGARIELQIEGEPAVVDVEDEEYEEEEDLIRNVQVELAMDYEVEEEAEAEENDLEKPVQEEDHLPLHVHDPRIVEAELEDDIPFFLECWIHRFVLHCRRIFNNDDKITSYEFEPASKMWMEVNHRKLHVDQQVQKRIYYHYDWYRQITIPWQEQIWSIYYTSHSFAVKSGNLPMLYIPVNRDMISSYKYILDEMGQTLHYLIYGTKLSADTGYSVPDWTYHTFHNKRGSSIPDPYIVVGHRLIMWNCDSSNLMNEVDEQQQQQPGFPQTIVFRALAVAALLHVCCAINIHYVQVYHVFLRRICTVNVEEWRSQKEFLRYLMKAKRDHFPGYDTE